MGGDCPLREIPGCAPADRLTNIVADSAMIRSKSLNNRTNVKVF